MPVTRLLPLVLVGCAPFLTTEDVRERADPCAWAIATSERATLLRATSACEGAWTIVGDVAGDAVGGALATVGDLDGDGWAELAVGSPDARDGRGAVHVFGGASLADDAVLHASAAHHALFGASPGDHLGAAYASVDSRDGTPGRELVIGAPGDDAGGAEAGAVVFVTTAELLASSTLGLSDVATRLEGRSRYGAGTALAVISTVDGDAFEEVLIGAPSASMGAAASGTVFVAHSSTVGLGATLSLRDEVAGFPYVTPDSRFGAALATYDGVLEDDRRSGFVAGAPWSPNDDWNLWGQVSWGRAWLFGDYAVPEPQTLRPVLEPYSAFAVNLRGETVFSYEEEELRWRDDEARLGSAVAVVPDMDGGGRDEIVIAGTYDAIDDVVVFVVRGEDMVDRLGSIWLLEDLASVRIVTEHEGPLTIPGVAGVRDLDGDGLGDLLIGDPSADADGAVDAGRLHVFTSADLFGDADIAGQRVLRLGDAGHVLDGTSAGARFGAAVAEIGDLDGDGVPEIAVGAPGERRGDDAAVGRVIVYRGGF